MFAVIGANAKAYFSCTSSGQAYTFLVDDVTGQWCCWKPAGGCPPGAPFVFEVDPDQYPRMLDEESDDDITNHIANHLIVSATAIPSPSELESIENAVDAAGGLASVPVVYIAGDELSTEQLEYLHSD